MKKVALITLHGMGKVDLTYFSGLVRKLKGILGNEWEDVSFHNVQYAPILQNPEDDLWEEMVEETSNKLDAPHIRKLFLFGFGDASSLEHSAQRNRIQYIAVQFEIQRALDYALRDFNGDSNKPIVVVAHSLGCQVISNYLWDAEYGKNIFYQAPDIEPRRLDFLKCKTLENLVTTGCNIPLFVSGIKDRKCFAKPNPNFVWDNYYDRDDVLGWPLKQLGPTYDVVRDHPVNAGGALLSWNVASHLGYWTDRNVVSPLASILRSKLQ